MSSASFSTNTDTEAVTVTSGGNSDGILVNCDNGIGLQVIATSNNALLTRSQSGIGAIVTSKSRFGLGVSSEIDTGLYAYSAEGDGAHISSTDGDGLFAYSEKGVGVVAESANDYGVYATSEALDAIVGYKEDDSGAAGSFANASLTRTGVTLRQAALFLGNVNIYGNFYVSGVKGFRIDHPLDPTGKWLHHASVESPELKTIYDGIVALNLRGEATVVLPEWFEDLNDDYRYQLTALGGPAPNLHISETIRNRRFVIAGGNPGATVSWQVTGIRKDPWAADNPLDVEQPKAKSERGTVLWPVKRTKQQSKVVLSPEMYGVLKRNGTVRSRRRKAESRAAARRRKPAFRK
jgi:hypothetical protein